MQFHFADSVFFQVIVMQTVDGVRKVLRRGKALVPRPCVSTEQEGNDYGRIVPERPTPFRSSSIDVLQAAVRSNGDAQYQKRAPPEDAERRPEKELSGASEHSGSFLYGWAKLRQGALVFLMVFVAAMRGAHIADFYMTKYAAKAQQALASALDPLTQGLLRQEEKGAQ